MFRLIHVAIITEYTQGYVQLKIYNIAQGKGKIYIPDIVIYFGMFVLPLPWTMLHILN
jgi:hypothetical protein